MKITELQIFDWVKIPDTKAPYRRILAIEDPYNNSVYVDDYGSPGDDDNYSICYIEPIPLTPEILEKNGYKEQIKTFHAEGYLFRIELGISYKYSNSNSRCEITAYVTETYNSIESYRKNPPSGFQFYISVFDENDRMKEAAKVKKHIYYVHELQHALRLCGLEELADNFKV